MHRTEGEWRTGNVALHHHQKQEEHPGAFGAQEVQSVLEEGNIAS